MKLATLNLPSIACPWSTNTNTITAIIQVDKITIEIGNSIKMLLDIKQPKKGKPRLYKVLSLINLWPIILELPESELQVLNPHPNSNSNKL